MLDHTHDQNATSWVESANSPDTPFPVQHLPFGRTFGRALTAIGDQVVDLSAVARARTLPVSDLAMGTLDGLQDPAARLELRHWLFEQLTSDESWLAAHREFLEPLAGIQMTLPFAVGDYTDFYASIHHATRVGSMFRPDNPLLPNYTWVPIGYHGRASSLIVSGTAVSRPSGQLKADDAPAPVFGPCKMLDYELELGCWVGRGNNLGETIPLENVRDHWIGVSLLNDWSARDIQRWEYQPLGPFLAKSFATSVSPWITTQEALAPFFCPAVPHSPPPLDYLNDERDQREGSLDLQLEVELQGQVVSRSNSKDLFWTLGQMLAHHASNGCPMRTGDLLASGTISGESPDAAGCLLELTWVGPGQPRRPVQLADGATRTFLQNGDEVVLRGWARRPGFRSLGLGECRGAVENTRP
ncbi:fumarylacetoacetase [bacterium SCN 62-11]|nr:MAG: fumarylacetoacetase [bacterium SCN 62-11]